MFQCQAVSVENLPHIMVQSTDHSPLPGCPAAPSGEQSQCEDAPHSAPPAG